MLIRLARIVRRLAVGMGIAVIGCLAGSALAAPPLQSGTPIRYGDTVSGEITEELPCQVYWFRGAQGDPVTIDMTRTSGGLDGVLALYLRDGNNLTANPIAFNDDRPGGKLDPLINTTLPAADWYTIAACRLQHENMRVTAGTFDLTLTGPEPAAGALEPAASPTAASGSLTEGVLPGAQGAGQPTPTSAPGLSEGVLPSASPQATPTPGQSLTTGAIPAAPQAEPESATAVAYGMVVSGQLDGSTGQTVYRLEVAAGDQVAVGLVRTSGDLAPLIRVEDAGGQLIAQAGSSEAVNTLELVFVALDDGAVTITIERYGGEVDGTAGEYELRVEVAEQPR